MKVIFALLLLLLAYWPEASASDFPCPDELSRELYGRVQELNRLHPLSQAEPGYSTLIELASKRPMDDLSLRLACFSLARRTFRTKCSDYGYECPDPGADLIKWPAQINDWIPKLKANILALKSCPEAYIREDLKLPTVRVGPILHGDILDEKITGWVLLKLDIDEFGKVTSAGVVSSKSSRLEQSALRAVRKFRYQPELVENRYVPMEDVSATVFFHYWDLAEAAGCSTNHE